MMKRTAVLALLGLACLCMATGPAFSMDVKGKHKGKVSCVDCHGTDSPDKPALRSACLKCHEKLSMREIPVLHEGRNVTMKPHMGPHDGGETQRCALCHKVHGPSKLSCSECHHTFSVTVP